MADSTPDSSRQDMLSLFIRYVDENFNPVERFIGIDETIGKTGELLSNQILSILEESGLDQLKLISQSYDYTANMSGQFKGVQNLITTKLNPNIIYIPCASHRSNTAVKHSCDESVDIITLFGKLQKIEKNNVDAETRQEAKSILKNMQCYSFILYLIFMKNVLAMTNALTCELQTESLNIISSIEVIDKTCSLLTTERNSDRNLRNIILLSDKVAEEHSIDTTEEFKTKHRPRRPPRKIGDNPHTTHVFTRAVFDRLITEYRELISNLIKNLRSVGKLSPNYIIHIDLNDAKAICEGEKIDDPNLLLTECQLYADDIKNYDNITAAGKFIAERKTLLPCLYQAFRYFLTFPVTVASNEREFNKLKIIKNRLRSTMGDERLKQ
ncbi:unnamed protein product [Didymodactylos carnosus]|uniref:HAT C-terminal dimerisation domain-containing protein n=1 Tax=Didymodactylos carnosus TaxID=1234261 RepID=A0A815LAC6_9BILA|nr:unnamed protein product [Didymodactylos carnosus]CAF4295293.1 unnamed protein product [Didymodactylos carnosus]